MTTRRLESRFGAVGKTIGGVLATVAGLVGAWGWFYLLAVFVQGPGGLSELSMPFFTIGLVFWIAFWGAALAMSAALFGRRSQVVRVAFGITGAMVATAVITPVVAVAVS